MVFIKKINLFFLVFALALFILIFLMLIPYTKTIIASATIAYIFYPLYKKLLKLIKNKSLTSLFMLIIVFMIVIVPLFLIFANLISEGKRVYSDFKSQVIEVQTLNFMEKLNLSERFSFINFEKIIEQISANFQKVLFSLTSKVLTAIPNLLLHLFIGLFAMFFFFKDGEVMITKFKEILGLPKHHHDFLSKEVSDMVYSTIYGNIIVALIQSIAALIGYFIFGVKTPVLFGVLTFFVSVLPYVGAPLVWFPISALMIVEGLLFNSPKFYNGIGLMLWGFFIVSTIDNITKPKIIGDKAKLHPLLVLLGIIGGIRVFGFIGIIIGPVACALASAIIKLQLKHSFELWLKE
ncbi:MAG: AI-2E family transporter [Candidatus Woesearchaeota archaeon]